MSNGSRRAFSGKTCLLGALFALVSCGQATTFSSTLRESLESQDKTMSSDDQGGVSDGSRAAPVESSGSEKEGDALVSEPTPAPSKVDQIVLSNLPMPSDENHPQPSPDHGSIIDPDQANVGSGEIASEMHVADKTMDDPAVPMTMEETVTAIKNACAELPQVTQKSRLEFAPVNDSPDPSGQEIAGKEFLRGSTCNWFRWDGKDKHSGFRSYLPVEPPALPEGATLCSSSLQSESGKDVSWVYDDEFFLTVNNRVLAASHRELVARFDQSDGFHVFDFSKIQGLDYTRGSESSDLFCLGHAGFGPGCLFPPTQVAGPVDLKFDAQIFAGVSALIKTENKLDVRLVITGDNDKGIDCEHSGIGFEWELNYVMPPSSPK